VHNSSSRNSKRGPRWALKAPKWDLVDLKLNKNGPGNDPLIGKIMLIQNRSVVTHTTAW
jgi:hypothetical protein